MILTIVIAIASALLGVAVINKLSDPASIETEPVDAEEPPVTPEPFVLDPPALPDFPDPIDWEGLSCKGINAKIQELRELLMTSKFPQYIYEFWLKQIEVGEQVFAENCKVCNDDDV